MSKKVIALFCACACMTAMAVGCGDTDEKTSSAVDSIAEVVSEEEVEDLLDELEDEVEDEIEEAEEELDDDNEIFGEEIEIDDEIFGDDFEADEEDTDEGAVVDNGEIDSEATMNSMTYGYCSTWQEIGTSAQMNYIMPDNSGAVTFQVVDASVMEDEEDMITTTLADNEEDMITALSDRCKSVWGSYEGMEVLTDQWDENSIPDKKAYVVEYKYEVAGTQTHNLTYFFANYTEDSKDVFAVTFSALTEDSEIDAYAEDILASISFAG